MEKTKVAINGFGRIGRLAFRQILDNPKSTLEVVAINDLTTPEMLAYLLKYDSSQGTFDKEVGFTADSIVVDGVNYKVFAEKSAVNLDWAGLGVDTVLECSGRYKSTSMIHINSGAKHVIINSPAGAEIPTIVFGVNDNILTGNEQILSGASCTTNCLAPVAKVLEDNFGIVGGDMNTIHAVTAAQNLLDGPNKKGNKMRIARAGIESIVPTTTGAAAALGLVIPSLNGKISGSAQRVPVKTGSTVILSVILKGKFTAQEINAVMKDNANETLGYNTDLVVSSDIIGMKFGSLFDATQTTASILPNGTTLAHVVAWYDNESSYTAQYLRLAEKLAK